MDMRRNDPRPSTFRRRLPWLAAATGGVGLLALVLGLEAAAPGVKRSQLWLDTVQRGEMVREVRGPGTLVPKEIRWVASETPARVERILVKPGASVEAGTVIIELSNPEVLDQALAAEAALKAAEADYVARQMVLESQILDQRALQAGVTAEHESARLQAEAEAELTQAGIISRLQSRRSRLAAEQLALRMDIERERMVKLERTVDAQLAADRARLAQLRNAAEFRRRQADGLSLRAGIAGVLQQVPVQEGQQVAAGANLARVARPGELMAELRIPEVRAKDVANGLAVRVDTRNGVVAGRVVRIDPAVVNGTVLVDVELQGRLPAGARPDLSVDGTIEIERLADVLHVGRPAADVARGELHMFRLDASGDQAIRVPVRLGRASVSRVEVLQGLAEGDQVVLSDTSEWDGHDRLSIE